MLTRVHIVGAPRSGTTLLLELMASSFHFDWHAPEEIPLLQPLPVTQGLCLSKRPIDYFAAPALLARDPSQWFIYTLRDPRDAVVSVHDRAADRYWANLGQWRRSWEVVRPLRDHPRLLLVRYEDLVGDPEAVQARIAERISVLQRRGSFRDYERRARPSKESLQALRGLRPVGAASVGLWRSHRPRLLEQLRLHGALTEVLLETGYERDARWLEELRGVEPDPAPGFWPDRDVAELAALQSQWLAEQLPPYLRWRGLGP